MQGEEISVDNISNKFLKTLDVPAFTLSSKHNSSRLLPEELPADLLHAPFIWLHRGSVVPPLLCPYADLRRGPCSFTIRVGSRFLVVSISHLKTCTDSDRRLSRNRFSPTLWGGFCTPWTSSDLIASTDAVSAATADSAPRLDL